MHLSAVDKSFSRNADFLLGICVYSFYYQSFGAVINTSNPQLLWQGPYNLFYMADWPQGYLF